MAKNIPYIYGEADSYVLPLTPQGGGDTFQVNPTIADGDFKIWKPSTSTWENLATTPTVISATGPSVLISWSAAEAAYEPFVIWGKDQAGAQWKSIHLYGRMTARGIDDLAQPGDEMDLVDAPNSTAITAIDMALTAAHGSGSWQNSAGSGVNTCTYTLTDDATLLPIVGATVYVCSDEDGLAVVAASVTNAFGVATFHLEAGTYYLFRYHSDYVFSNPDTETAS